MKLKVQAQHLQPGDIVDSGERVDRTFIPSFMDKNKRGKIAVSLYRDTLSHTNVVGRVTYWGKYTEINIERPEKVEKLDAYSEAILFATGHLPEDF